MATSRIENNVVKDSVNTTILNNVYNGADEKSEARRLRIWMTDRVRKAETKSRSLPNNFADGLMLSILDEPSFVSCLQQERATLLLTGKMGAGKTTTACGIVRELSNISDVVVGFVLIDCHSPAAHDARTILMLLLSQLADPEIEAQRDHLSRLCRHYPDDYPSADETTDVLVQVLGHLLNTQHKNSCLILDGLDEFIDQESLIALLHHLKHIQSQTACGIIMTSRLDESTVRAVFGKCATLQVSARDEDIKEFVSKHSSSHTVHKVLDQNVRLRDTIGQTVIDRSGGLFLLVKLNTSYIMRANTQQAFFDSLNDVRSLPLQGTDKFENSSLERAFSDALDRHIERLFQNAESTSIQGGRDIRDIFVFVRDAARPLKVHELLHLLALRHIVDEFQEDALWDPQDVSAVTQGLVDITDSGTVRFAHHSLKTYLRRSPRWQEAFPVSNHLLAKLCVRYLSWPCFSAVRSTKNEIKEVLCGRTFLDYASQYWHLHYRLSKSERVEEQDLHDLRKSIVRLFTDDDWLVCAQHIKHVSTLVGGNQIVHHSQALLRANDEPQIPATLHRSPRADSSGYLGPNATGKLTGLHLICRLDLVDLVHEIVEVVGFHGMNCSNDRGENPIHVAVVHASDDLVKILLESGVNINAQTSDGLSAWHIVAVRNRASLAKLFLAQPKLDLNARMAPDDRWQTRYYEMASTRPRKVSISTERAVSGSTALHLVVRKGHSEIAEMIVKDERAQATIEDEDGMTAFHKACKYGRLDAVKLMVSRWSTLPLYRSKRDGRTGFHLACKYKDGYEAAVYLLQNHPGVRNIRDGDGKDALYHAELGENVRCIDLLRKHDDRG